MIQVVNDSADTRKMLHITVEGVMVIVPTKGSSNSAILLGLRFVEIQSLGHLTSLDILQR